MIYQLKTAHPVTLVLEMQKESLQIEKEIANGRLKSAGDCIENLVSYATELSRRINYESNMFNEGD